MLLLETCFTRSEVEDIRLGTRLAHHLLQDYRGKPAWQIKIAYVLSIFYQQMATLRAIAGELNEAKSFQAKSWEFDAFSRSRQGQGGSASDTRLGNFLRSRAVATKYMDFEVGVAHLGAWERAVLDSPRIAVTNDYRYLLDLGLGAVEGSKLLREKLYLTASALIESGGYGCERNMALCVTLRRRWWLLHLLCEERPNLSLLAQDLEFWRTSAMENEIRELQAGVSRLSKKLSGALAQEVQVILSSDYPR